MKKTILLLLITLAVLFGSVPAEAAKWKFVAVTATGQSTYIDTTSILGGPSESREAWSLVTYSPPECTMDYPKSLNKCFAKGLAYERYFNDKSTCTLQLTFYFSDGTNDGVSSFPCNPTKVVPGSVEELKWKQLYE